MIDTKNILNEDVTPFYKQRRCRLGTKLKARDVRFNTNDNRSVGYLSAKDSPTSHKGEEHCATVQTQ